MHNDLRFEQAVSFARDLVRIPSISGEEEAVARRVADELKRLRFDDVWVDEIGNVLARVRGRDHGPSIMLSSHLDVVDVGDLGQWEYAPFSGEIVDGYLHGRGSTDCKGPLALQTYAAASFLKSRPSGDIYIAHTVLEERGSWGMAHVMEHGDIHPLAVIIGEATAGDICIGHRGRAELLITIRGKAAHASAPHRAHNPIDFLPSVLSELRTFAERLPSHAVLCDPTLVPTIVETWPRSPNMVPEEVRIVVDWRMLPANTVEALRTYLQNRIGDVAGYNVDVREVSETKRAYTGLQRTGQISTAGFLLSDSHPLVQAAVKAVQASTGVTPVARPWTFGTDGCYSCGVYGVPTIGYAPGQEMEAHTNHERLHLEAARTAYNAYPALIRELQQALAADALSDAHLDGRSDHLFIHNPDNS
jgi:succinyl-diaminopimelate desuccinylase